MWTTGRSSARSGLELPPSVDVRRDDPPELTDDYRLRGWIPIDPSTAPGKEGTRSPLPPSSSASRVMPEADSGVSRTGEGG
jgi:hypothetical protein